MSATCAGSSVTLRRSRRLTGAAALVAAALAVSGCTRDEAATTTNPPTLAPAPTPSPIAAVTAPTPPSTATPSVAATPAPPAPTTAPPPPPTTVPLDAAVMLASALDALGAGYHFVTTATVNDQVAVEAVGDHIAGSTHMAVTSSGTSTEYLVTADAAWALAEGTWEQLDSTPGLSDPVGQLRSPLAASATGTPEAATIVAQYRNAALGLAGDGQAAVEFQLAAGQIASLRFTSTAVITNADGTTTERPAEVTATITPVAPGTQITLPAAEP